MHEELSDTSCFEITIAGRVQGVWFRKSTQDEARKLDLAGFVRNMPDGTVHIKVSGPEDACRQFIEWCHHGPPLARVRRIRVAEIDEQFSGEFLVVR